MRGTEALHQERGKEQTGLPGICVTDVTNQQKASPRSIHEN
jgi:hypothetical protein